MNDVGNDMVCYPISVFRRQNLVSSVPPSPKFFPSFPTFLCDWTRVAGFRPGSRGPFVSAKGPKTSDAPSGLSRWDGREP